MRAPSALVVGELNVDLIAAGLTQSPRLGVEIEASDFALVLGSASAIFAAGLSRLGHGVAFVSKVGNDFFGSFCRTELTNLGVDTSGVRMAPGLQTGVTLCMSTARDRAQVTFAGAIAELGLSDIPSNVFAGRRHLHVSCFALQRRLRPALRQLLSRAKREGLSTSFDPNCSLDGPMREQALRLLPKVDLLFLNEREASELSGERSPLAAARALSQRAGSVVVKLGRKGALVAQAGTTSRVPGLPVQAVDTTGAGDSFAAGYVSAFLRGLTARDCLGFGNACGALSTLAVGGTGGQANQREAQALLARWDRR